MRQELWANAALQWCHTRRIKQFENKTSKYVFWKWITFSKLFEYHIFPACHHFFSPLTPTLASNHTVRWTCVHCYPNRLYHKKWREEHRCSKHFWILLDQWFSIFFHIPPLQSLTLSIPPQQKSQMMIANISHYLLWRNNERLRTKQRLFLQLKQLVPASYGDCHLTGA